MKVFVKGKGEVTLTQTNFVAQGGQASVYQRNGTAYKIYTNPKDAIPEVKFAELAAIDDPNVVRPEDLLLSASTSSAPIGYTMRYVSDTYALCELFPKAFRERHGFDHEKVRRLVAKFQEHVARVHRAGVLVVDLNELNVLATGALDELFMIDVDSYQTRSFKAEVIMPSVRDWTVKPAQFSVLSDWYSFAILAFQLYIGIHPYRGTHAATASIQPDKRLEHRMRHNLSALGPGVSLPKICPALDVIPEHQRAWMRAVLQEGRRLPPPDPAGIAAAVVAPRPVSARLFGAGIQATECAHYEGDIIGFIESGGHALALTTKGFYLDGRLVRPGAPAGVTVLGFTPKMNAPVALNLQSGTAELIDLKEKTSKPLPLKVREIAGTAGRLYVRTREQVLELDIVGGKDAIVALLPVASVLEHAARLHQGCALQSMGGSAFASLFPRSRAGYQVRIPELNAYRVVEAKADGRVLMVLGVKDGRYDRLVFVFDESFATYDLRVVEGVATSGLNFVVSPAGVCVAVTEDEAIEAFHVAQGPRVLRVVEDQAIGGDMRLLLVGGRVGYAQGEKLYTMSLK